MSCRSLTSREVTKLLVDGPQADAASPLLLDPATIASPFRKLHGCHSNSGGL